MDVVLGSDIDPRNCQSFVEMDLLMLCQMNLVVYREEDYKLLVIRKEDYHY